MRALLLLGVLVAVWVAPTWGKEVYAHFMVGNSYGYDQGHFANDMAAAQAVGIDAFALNVGSDSWTWDRVSLAYSAAASKNFKVFLSFDMNFYSSITPIVNGILQVASSGAQLKWSGTNKPVVSTFGGSGVNMGYSSADAAWAAIKSTLSGKGVDIFFIANFEVDANTIFQNNPHIDGALSWGAWPNPNGDASSLTGGDVVYMNSSRRSGKVYVAPVSPWFFTHLSYKNYIYHTETLWFDRWQELVQKIKPDAIEIITWNDWGESHYIGAIDSNSGDLPAGSQAYVDGFSHESFRAILPYFISYYKNNGPPRVSQDLVIFWHRPSLKDARPSGDSLGQPYVANQDTSRSGYSPSQVLEDNVYVASILQSAATVQVVSGGATHSISVPGGASIISAPMGTGQQTIKLLRGTNQVCSVTSPVSVSNNPATYNYNVITGQC